MAKQRRAKRVVSRTTKKDRDDVQSVSERAAESVTEIATLTAKNSRAAPPHPAARICS